MAKGDGQFTEQDYKLAKEFADSLESYLNEIETKIILVGITKEEQEEQEKVVRKLIKKLRKGKLDEVYDLDAYEEYIDMYDRGAL